MSQDAGAGQSKRSSGPAFAYSPMVYQFPSESGGEKEQEKSQNNQPNNFLIPFLIILLVIGGVVLYLRENGIEVRDLGLRRSILEQPRGFRSYGSSYGSSYGYGVQMNPPPFESRARVASAALYLREGPGMAYSASYLLPENWRVSLTGDYEKDMDGYIWAKVLVQTDQGLQEGWVSRRFIDQR